MRAAVRTPSCWLGVAAALVGGWWLIHADTVKYVLGLLLLTAGVVLVMTIVLVRVQPLRRAVVVLGIAVAVVAAGLIVPAVRADREISRTTIWIAEASGSDHQVVGDQILVLGNGGVASGGEFLALDREDGRIERRGESRIEGPSGAQFTRGGDVVESGGDAGTFTVEYYTSRGQRIWSRDFADSRLKQVAVIAADDGRAAVRTCAPSNVETPRDPCLVEGVGPTGDVEWTAQLGPLKAPEGRLVGDVLGVVPGTVDGFQQLDLVDGSVQPLERPGRDEKASDHLDEVSVEDTETAFVDDAQLVVSVPGVEGLKLSGGGGSVHAAIDGKDAWSVRIPGAGRVEVANGGIAVLSDPTGWSPFRRWTSPDPVKITMLDPRTGEVTATALVPYEAAVYPVGRSAALVTGPEDDESSPGHREQRLVGRL